MHVKQHCYRLFIKAPNGFTATSIVFTDRKKVRKSIYPKPQTKVKLNPEKKSPKKYLFPRSVVNRINNNHVIQTFLEHIVSISSSRVICSGILSRTSPGQV